MKKIYLITLLNNQVHCKKEKKNIFLWLSMCGFLFLKKSVLIGKFVLYTWIYIFNVYFTFMCFYVNMFYGFQYYKQPKLLYKNCTVLIEYFFNFEIR